jgi:hypothetical protein
MFDVNKKRLVLQQLTTVILAAISFFFIAQVTTGLNSFRAAMAAYWVILVIQIAWANKGRNCMSLLLQEILNRSNAPRLSLLCFVPSALVFFVAFVPLIAKLKPTVLMTVILIGLVNGLLEEIYWRGSVYKRKDVGLTLSSLALFALNHGAFLFFNLNYEGGAANLIGAPLIMGSAWMALAKKAGTIKFGILAHQLVNIFAFYALFVSNS